MSAGLFFCMDFVGVALLDVVFAFLQVAGGNFASKISLFCKQWLVYKLADVFLLLGLRIQVCNISEMQGWCLGPYLGMLSLRLFADFDFCLSFVGVVFAVVTLVFVHLVGLWFAGKDTFFC